MEYKGLDAINQEIRLITILPESPVSEKIINQPGHQYSALDDLVQCRLEPVSLGDLVLLQGPSKSKGEASLTKLQWDGCYESSSYQNLPKWRYSWGDYVALSYTWGDATNTRNIIVNGHQVAIGANLESALQALRRKPAIKSGYKLWADAICINQQDIAERGREVRRMGKIYRQAHDVVIWLGNEGAESDKAMYLIRTLSDADAKGQDRLGNSLREQPEFGQGFWRALGELLDRPYWDRLWVLQEIALGWDRTSVLCGQQAVTWKQFYIATYLFRKHNLDVMISLIDRERKGAGLSTPGLKRNKLIHLNMEHLVQARQEKRQYMCILDLGRKSLATDPRDKIYGLLGMMETSVSDRIVPDYNATLVQVFTDFAKAFITASMSCLFPKAQSTCNSSAIQAGSRLTKAMKTTTSDSSNNACTQETICHPGYPTGQTQTTIVFAAVV